MGNTFSKDQHRDWNYFGPTVNGFVRSSGLIALSVHDVKVMTFKLLLKAYQSTFVLWLERKKKLSFQTFDFCLFLSWTPNSLLMLISCYFDCKTRRLLLEIYHGSILAHPLSVNQSSTFTIDLYILKIRKRTQNSCRGGNCRALKLFWSRSYFDWWKPKLQNKRFILPRTINSFVAKIVFVGFTQRLQHL